MSEKSAPTKNLNGLRGWLIVFFVWLVINIVVAVVGIGGVFAFQRVAMFIAEQYLPFLHILTWVQAVEYVLWALALLWISVLFFQKKKLFPKALTIVLWVGAAAGLFDLIVEIAWNQLEGQLYFAESFLVENVNTFARLMVVGVVWAVVWSLYVRRSKRVKATFVR